MLGDRIDWQFGSRQLVSVGVILAVLGDQLPARCARRADSIRPHAREAAGIAAIVVGVFLFRAKAQSGEHFTAPVRSGALARMAGLRRRRAGRALGIRWVEQHADGRRRSARTGPQHPAALIAGMAIVMLAYAAANLAYFYALPFAEILSANSTAHREALPVAAKAAQSFLGANGPKLVSLAFLFSALGVLNGSLLTNARVPYAMARDGLFFRRLPG